MDEEPAETVVEEAVEDEEIDWDSIPQGKPEGVRVGGEEERRVVICPTCNGAGSYEIDVFIRQPGETQPKPGKASMPCATCSRTGKVVEV